MMGYDNPNQNENEGYRNERSKMKFKDLEIDQQFRIAEGGIHVTSSMILQKAEEDSAIFVDGVIFDKEAEVILVEE